MVPSGAYSARARDPGLPDTGSRVHGRSPGFMNPTGRDVRPGQQPRVVGLGPRSGCRPGPRTRPSRRSSRGRAPSGTCRPPPVRCTEGRRSDPGRSCARARARSPTSRCPGRRGGHRGGAPARPRRGRRHSPAWPGVRHVQHQVLARAGYEADRRGDLVPQRVGWRSSAVVVDPVVRGRDADLDACRRSFLARSPRPGRSPRPPPTPSVVLSCAAPAGSTMTTVTEFVNGGVAGAVWVAAGAACEDLGVDDLPGLVVAELRQTRVSRPPADGQPRPWRRLRGPRRHRCRPGRTRRPRSGRSSAAPRRPARRRPRGPRTPATPARTRRRRCPRSTPRRPRRPPPGTASTGKVTARRGRRGSDRGARQRRTANTDDSRRGLPNRQHGDRNPPDSPRLQVSAAGQPRRRRPWTARSSAPARTAAASRATKRLLVVSAADSRDGVAVGGIAGTGSTGAAGAAASATGVAAVPDISVPAAGRRAGAGRRPRPWAPGRRRRPRRRRRRSARPP